MPFPPSGIPGNEATREESQVYSDDDDLAVRTASGPGPSARHQIESQQAVPARGGPASIVQGWSKDDFAHATDFVEALLEGGHPTENLDVLAELQDAVLNTGSSNEGPKKRQTILELDADTKSKLDSVYDEMRKQFLRNFHIHPEELHNIILRTFGSTYDKDEPARYRLLKQRTRNLKDQWKSKSIRLFIEHVKGLIQGNVLAESNSNAKALVYFFSTKWNVESLGTLFYWASSIIDFPACASRPLKFLRHIYISFCVEVKLHIGNEFSKEHNLVVLGSFWDSMGNSSAWIDVTPEMFPRRPIAVSAKSRELDKRRKPLRMDDHPRFNLVADLEDDDLEDDDIFEPPERLSLSASLSTPPRPPAPRPATSAPSTMFQPAAPLPPVQHQPSAVFPRISSLLPSTRIQSPTAPLSSFPSHSRRVERSRSPPTQPPPAQQHHGNTSAGTADHPRFFEPEQSPAPRPPSVVRRSYFGTYSEKYS